MNKLRKISLMVVAMMFATIANAYNFTVGNISGKQGETKTISIGLNNETEDITAFAGEFQVPEGVEIVYNEDEEEYAFTLSGRKSTTHILGSAKQTSGNIMVTCYSSKNKVFTGTSGELFTGQLKLTGAPGTYTLKLVNAYVTSTAAKDFTCADVTFTVTILQNSVNVSNITLNKTETSLTVGETETLSATVSPNDATDQSVTWSSSNDKVATVSAEGVVTAIAAGEAVITATAADGSGVKASCTVTVTSTVEPDPNNILSIADVQTKVGNTILIPVSLTNEVDVYGLQCDIYLSSSDISLTVDTRGRYVFKQNADRVDGQTASSKLQADGAVRYMIADYTAENPFYENEGELFYISVDIPENAADEYSVTLKNITLATDKEKILCPEITSKITVQKYTLADVDDDGVIDVQDVLRTAQLVLNSGYNIAADMDEDGLIDVQDVIMVARAVLEQTNNAPAMITPPAAKANGKEIITDYLAIEAADNGSLAISLNNSDEYYGFQMDIELPEGYSFVKDVNGNAEISLNDAKLSEFTVMQNMFANNKMRVLAFSDAQNTIMQNIGELFNVKVRKDNERLGNSCEVRISNIVFSHDMGKVKLSGLTESVLVDDATNINSISEDGEMQNVYTIDGKKVKTAVRNSINIINGKKTIIK